MLNILLNSLFAPAVQSPGHSYCATPWGQLEASTGLSAEGQSLGKVLPRGSALLAQDSIAAKGSMPVSLWLPNREFHPCQRQGNTQVLKQLNSRPTSWIKYFYKIEVLWSLRVTDFIAQMHRNGRAIACAAEEGQCTKSSPHWEIIPPRLLTPATGDTQ